MIHDEIKSLKVIDGDRGGARNFCLGGPSYSSNIFIKITPHTHIHTLFYYIHTFLFDKLYIYTHQTTTKRA